MLDELPTVRRGTQVAKSPLRQSTMVSARGGDTQSKKNLGMPKAEEMRVDLKERPNSAMRAIEITGEASKKLSAATLKRRAQQNADPVPVQEKDRSER